MHKKTGQWVFGRDDHGSNNFVQWVEAKSPDSDIFWVTGKPGSGKSTLIKFIINSQQTRTSLKLWAGERPMLLLSSYLWISGSTMQKNQAGLIRRLLCQAVSEANDLASTVFAERFRTYRAVDRYRWQSRPWAEAELRRLLSRLVATARKTMSVVILINGLDEYEGDPEEVIDLLDGLRIAGNTEPNATNTNPKFCVASRLWAEFEATFSRKPNLRMEQLNEQDINDYAADKISEHPRFLAAAAKNQLIDEIRAKAEGVFL